MDELRELLAEGLAVTHDLMEKTDIYLGINDAIARQAAWEARVSEVLARGDDNACPFGGALYPHFCGDSSR